MHLARFLQGVLNVGQPKEGGAVRFIFISRHPIANALAHRSLPECRDFSIPDLVHHWVLLHEFLAEDFPRLHHARNLTLEKFVEDPAAHIAQLWEFMGLGPAHSSLEEAAKAAATVHRDPNAKYRGAYCRQVTSSPEEAAGHRRLVSQFNSRVKSLGLGYDLNEWPCLASII